MMNFATWQAATSCTGTPTPGAKALLAWCLENYPIGKSMGIYNCRAVRGTTTTYSIHSEGRALDYGLPLVNSKGNPIGYDIVRRLGEHGVRLGVQSIIFDRTIWSSRSPSGRYYSGVAPHYDHLHIELTRNAGSSLTLTTLRSVLGTSANSGTGGAIPSSCINTVLRQGNTGSCVKVLQNRLNALQYSVGVADGNFGTKTTAAVVAFQKSKGLTSDGVVGPRTWAALA